MNKSQNQPNANHSARLNPASSLRPSYCINSDDKNIRKLAAKITAPHRQAHDKARGIFDYVRDEIPYNFAPHVTGHQHFRASHTLRVGSGFCMQKAALFAALCRASGIPARISFQDIVDYKIVGPFLELAGSNFLPHHGLNAVYLGGRWLRVDCTLDRALSERKNYHLVKFDGRHEALLPKTDQAGKPHFDILKQYSFYNDTPAFARSSVMTWIAAIPWDRWVRLAHRKDGSM